MTIEQENKRALGRAFRAMLRVADEMPVDMQTALLQLAVAEWPEPNRASASLETQKQETTEHAHANDREAEEACRAGSATR